MERSITRVRIFAGASLLLLAAGGLLSWIDKSIQERDRLRIELAEERLRLQALEQVWSGKLETVQSAKAAAEQKLGECEARNGNFGGLSFQAADN